MTEWWQQQIDETNDGRYTALVVLGCISSTLAMFGSGCIIYMTIPDLQKKIVQRILFSLSISDFVASSSCLLMPFSVPSYLELPGAIGTHGTCTTTGFLFMMLTTTGAYYNACLSLYYYLSVVRGWKEWDFGGCYWEALFHAVGICVPLGLNIAALTVQAFNPNLFMNGLCTYGSIPWGCDDEDIDMTDDCQRSNPNIMQHLITFLLILQGCPSLVGFACTFLVWWTVRKTITRSSAYRFDNNSNGSGIVDERIQQVSTQAILYSLAYLNTLAWPTVGVIIMASSPSAAYLATNRYTPGFYTIQVLFWTFAPLQGFLNFFIYVRLKVQHWKKVEPERSILWIYSRILASDVPPARKSRSTTDATIPLNNNNKKPPFSNDVDGASSNDGALSDDDMMQSFCDEQQQQDD